MIPSGKEWRQPYTLSNLDLVTQSLTLIAGKRSSPFAAISLSRCTPVVVSSETPLQNFDIRVHLVASTWMESLMVWSTHLNSGLVVLFGSGSDLSFAYFSSNSLPLWISMVASPPSSTICSGPSVSFHVSICSVHHQYSGSLALPREDDASSSLGNCSSSVILGTEDVARRPA